MYLIYSSSIHHQGMKHFTTWNETSNFITAFKAKGVGGSRSGVEDYAIFTGYQYSPLASIVVT